MDRPMETSSKQLVLKNISKHFGSLVAVKDVDLVIAPGEFVCFLGPSGCGKTTLLRIITGFEQQSTGDVIYDGKVINDVIPQKRDFGIVFQSYALFPIPQYDGAPECRLWFKNAQNAAKADR